jgi:hypothetical protein
MFYNIGPWTVSTMQRLQLELRDLHLSSAKFLSMQMASGLPAPWGMELELGPWPKLDLDP